MNRVWHPLKKGQKISLGLDGFQKFYVIYRLGLEKSCVCLQGGWVGQNKAKNVLT